MSKPTVSRVLWMVFALVLSVPVLAEEAKKSPSPLAEMSVSPTRIDWSPSVEAQRWVLTLTGPDELFLRRELKPGKALFLSIFDAEGDRLPDGSYTWELKAVSKPANPRRQSGSFSIQGGSFVETPRGNGGSASKPPLVLTTAEDSIETGNLIVQQNACIGDECSTTDANFSALKLKSVQPDILFDGIELPEGGGGSPHDWALFVNYNNVARFSIVDFTNARFPFSITGGAPDSSLFIAGNGDLGAGTASPIEKLHLFENADAGTRILIENPNAGLSASSALTVRSNTAVGDFKAHGSGRTFSRFGQTMARWGELAMYEGNGLAVGTANNTPLILGTNDANRVHITATGNVGVGTSSPTKRLTVKSAVGNDDVVQVIKSSGSTPIFRVFETTSGDGLASLFDNMGIEGTRWTSVSGGKLALGCNAPEHRLDIGDTPGSACSAGGSRSFIDAGSTTFTASSSRSIKENLKPLQARDILDRISEVGVYSFDFIDGPKSKIGLMAEDFHAIFKNGSDKLINGQEVEMALWLAVQELTAQNKKLNERLAELEARLVAAPAP